MTCGARFDSRQGPISILAQDRLFPMFKEEFVMLSCDKGGLFYMIR